MNSLASVPVCKWWDDQTDDACNAEPETETCSNEATHFSCCLPGVTPNACFEHRCRCFGQRAQRTAHPPTKG